MSDLYLARSSYCDLCSDTLQGCKHCQSTSICTTCHTDNNFILNTSNSRCVCVNTSYAVNTTTNCSFCGDLMNGCLTCTTKTRCSSCKTTGFVLNTTYLCQCDGLNNYTAKGLECVLCSSQIVGCLNCSNPTTCTYCN